MRGAKRACVVCREQFTARDNRTICCSVACGTARLIERNKFRRRGLAASKTCCVCGCQFRVSFERRRAKTCSGGCSATLRQRRRKAYLAVYNAQNREAIQASNAAYYRKNRAKWEEENAETTAAAQLVKQIVSVGAVCLARDLPPPSLPTCAVCGVSFRPKWSKATLCGNAQCRSEWGRRWGRGCENKQRRASFSLSMCQNADRAREAARRSADKARFKDPEKKRELNRQSAARRSAALKLVREIEFKGLEALL